MKTQLFTKAATFATCLTLAATNVNANEQYQGPNQLEQGHFAGKYEQQRVGTGLGMFVGALVAGPVGMAVAGYVGNQIGESQGEGEEIVYLKRAMKDADQELARVKAQNAEQLQLAKQRIAAMQQQYVDRQIQYEKQMAAMHQASMIDKSLAVSMQFRTGSSDIEPVYQQQLIEMAKVMKDMSQYSLDLSGYADRQGDESFNHNLSKQRADAVKAFLVSQGVNAERINTQAFGESQPLQATQTAQSDFFDRRVMLKLKPAVQAVVKNH